MKKVVIFAILVVIIAGSIWYWYSQPTPTTFEIISKQAAIDCGDDINDLKFLVKSLQGSDVSGCDNVKYEVLKSYCLGFFGKDSCTQLSPDFQKSCSAILQKNSGECDDEMCHAVLGNEPGCTSSVFRAVARRDISVLESPAVCDENVKRAAKMTECTQKSKNIEDLNTCLNQSSLTV